MTVLPAAGPTPPADLYAAGVLSEALRALGMMDRESMSPTAGCCDRTFWAWKFVDAPAPRFQESLFTMAFLFAAPLPDAGYQGNPLLLEWIGRGLRFWSGLQHSDGSFDEAYPFERSLAATAFTSFYVGEALELVGRRLPAPTLDSARETLARAGGWLTANDETHGFLSNHLAAAAAALSHIYRQTGDSRFESRGRYFVDRILRRQSEEGWYDEYGGADPGYQSHGSFYLARCWQFGRDERVLASLRRAAQFLAHFVHADGSIGGEYTSRNTQTYYPAAYEILATEDPASAWIAQTMRPSLTRGASAGLRGVDAFNYFPFLNNYAAAHLACAGRAAPLAAAADPTPETGVSWFPEAGLARVRTARYEAHVGGAKGGVIKVFDRRTRELTFSDCGYIGRLRNRRLVSTQYQDLRRATYVTDSSIEIDGELMECSRPTMTPARFVAFRVFTLTAGRLPRLARWLKAQLVRTLIYRRRPIRVRFARRIEFTEQRVRVVDRLTGPDARELAELRWSARFTTIHMGSSRYFVHHELTPIGPDVPVDPSSIAGGLELERSVDVGD